MNPEFGAAIDVGFSDDSDTSNGPQPFPLMSARAEIRDRCQVLETNYASRVSEAQLWKEMAQTQLGTTIKWRVQAEKAQARATTWKSRASRAAAAVEAMRQEK